MHNLLLSFFNAPKYCIERGCILIIVRKYKCGKGECDKKDTLSFFHNS